MSMITALTRSVLASFSSIFRNGRSPVISPSTLILAMWSVRRLNPSGPPASTKARMARAAAMMAAMRQKLRERRSLRRAAIESASSVIFSHKSRGRAPGWCASFASAGLSLGLGLGQGGTQNIAQGCTGVRRAILRDRRLLLGDLQRLDRHLDLEGALLDLDHLGIDLLADGKTLGPLLGAVAGEIAAADEGADVGTSDLHLDAVVLDLDHLAGDGVALLDAGDLLHRIAGDLLDAQRDALLLGVDIEHHGFDDVALLVVLDRLLAGPSPIQIREVGHAVDIALEADEQAEFGDVLDLALDVAAGRKLLGEHHPWIVEGLLQAERDAALDRIDLEHLDGDLLGGGEDLAGVDVLLGPAHLGNVDKTLDTLLDL